MHRPTRKAKAEPTIGRTSYLAVDAAFCNKVGLEVGGLDGVLAALVKTSGVVKVGSGVSNVNDWVVF